MSDSELESRFDWINSLRVEVLKSELDQRGLPTEGLKAQLQERLKTFMMYGYATFLGPTRDSTQIIQRQEIGTDPRTPSGRNSEEINSRPITPDVEIRCSYENPIPTPEPPISTAVPCVSQPPHVFQSVNPDPSTQPRMRSSNLFTRENEFNPYIPPLLRPSRLTTLSEQTFVQEKVRKWNLKFDGQTDPESFMERLFELQESYAFTDEELFKALPELFIKDALVWYRNNRRYFDTWEDFIKIWSNYYRPENYLERLEEQIARTKQGPIEKGRDFVAQMQTRIRRHGNYSPQKELRVIYSNLRAEYRQYIRKTEVTSISSLVRQIDDFEKLKIELENEKQKFVPKPLTNSSKRDDTTSTFPPTPVRRVITCYNCGNAGHISRQCSQPQKKGNFVTANVQEGHISQQPTN